MGLRRSSVAILVVAALAPCLFGCTGSGGGSPGPAPDAGRARPAPEADAAPPADAAAPSAADSAAAPAPPEPAKNLPACGLAGERRELEQVVASDVVLAGGRPAALVVLARPRPEPLDMEGSEPLPELRSLYVVAAEAGEGEDWAVIHLADDPGPVRDHFGRRAYERLADVRGACDALGCLVAIVTERVTPDYPGVAFTTFLQLLDDSGEPQGDLRRLAQEPDRGEALSACLGVSAEGTLLATAVRGGRGRLLWLDRRAMPLDMRFVPGGFDFCTIRPAGMRLEVAARTGDGITVTTMGARAEAPDASADGGEGDDPAAAAWLPSLPPGARLPVLTGVGESPAILLGVDRGVAVASPGRAVLAPVLDGWSAPPRWLGAAPLDDGLVAVAVDGQGQLALARLDASLEVAAASTIAGTEADAAWVVAPAGSSTLWVGWRRSAKLALQRAECPAAAEAAAAGPAVPLAAADAFADADRRAVGRLKTLASQADSQDQHYRAAWLLERAYHLQPSSHELLLRSAGHLTGIRYSKAALRQLERLSKLGPAAEATLHAACRDTDFERLWSAGEFQRITGCRAPAAARPDARAEAAAPEGEQEPAEEPAAPATSP